MKTNSSSNPSSQALPSAEPFDERLRDVCSYHAATARVDEYLSSIQIDDDHPAFVFDWQENNVIAFVAAANGLNRAQAPPWLRTRPPNITAGSFIDDVVSRFRMQPLPLAGGRFGHIVLAPNNLQQYGAIAFTLGSLQNDTFLQNAARVALPVVNNVEPYLAVTAHLADRSVHNARPNTLPPPLRNGRPLRQLFI